MIISQQPDRRLHFLSSSPLKAVIYILETVGNCIVFHFVYVNTLRNDNSVKLNLNGLSCIVGNVNIHFLKLTPCRQSAIIQISGSPEIPN